MRLMRNGPSPAMIVAALALVLALAGTAIAAPDIATKAITKSKVKRIAKKQAKKQLRKNISGSHVNLADRATTADTADRATEADRAATADNARNATNATNATNAQNATNAENASTLDGLDSAAFAPAGHNHDDRYYTKSEIDVFLSAMRFPETGNGVGNNFGCQGGELGVRLANGLGAFVDHRFTFQVQGVAPAQAWGQIRSDGSIRSSSVNVTGVTHVPNSGVYCIQFNANPNPGDLEGAVVTLHFD